MVYKDLKNTTFLCFRIWYADRRGNAKNFQVHECCIRLYQIDSILLAFNLKKK